MSETLKIQKSRQRNPSILEKTICAQTAAINGLAHFTFNPYALPRTISNILNKEKRERIGLINCLAVAKGYLAGIATTSFLVYKDINSENPRHYPVYLAASIIAANLAVFALTEYHKRKQKN